MLRDASSRGHMRGGGCAVVRQGHLIAVVVAFLVGCAVLLVAGASGVQAQDSKKVEARCQGTRTIRDSYITNDIPGCPKGGLLLGTEGSDRTISRKPARPSLDGADGDDTISGMDQAMTSSMGVTATMVWAQTWAKTSSMAGLATISLIPVMMGGTSSIAVLAGTNTSLTRTTMWIAVARRMPVPGRPPSNRGAITTYHVLRLLRLRPAPARFR